MRQFFLVTAILLLQSSQIHALSVGTINARHCIEQSRPGKAEQSQFEDLRRQLEQGVENKEKELHELKPKLSDEYLDTLTPEAESQLKEKAQLLQQEHQELYYNMSMVLNKANYDVMQKMLDKIQQAAKAVAEKKKLDLILNAEACFYTNSSIDITQDIIQHLDSAFETQKK